MILNQLEVYVQGGHMGKTCGCTLRASNKTPVRPDRERDGTGCEARRRGDMGRISARSRNEADGSVPPRDGCAGVLLEALRACVRRGPGASACGELRDASSGSFTVSTIGYSLLAFLASLVRHYASAPRTLFTHALSSTFAHF